MRGLQIISECDKKNCMDFQKALPQNKLLNSIFHEALFILVFITQVKGLQTHISFRLGWRGSGSSAGSVGEIHFSAFPPVSARGGRSALLLVVRLQLAIGCQFRDPVEGKCSKAVTQVTVGLEGSEKLSSLRSTLGLSTDLDLCCKVWSFFPSSEELLQVLAWLG